MKLPGAGLSFLEAKERRTRTGVGPERGNEKPHLLARKWGQSFEIHWEGNGRGERI